MNIYLLSAHILTKTHVNMECFNCMFLFICALKIGKTSPLQWGRKSVENCINYGHQNSDRITFPIIVGGTQAGEFEYSHMAALGYGNATEWSWKCGGSLISENTILTAAHCLYTKFGEVKVARLGTKNVVNPEATYRDYNVAQRMPHPNYNVAQKYNDIGLLRLNVRVTLSPKIKPACLHITTNFGPGTLSATGWGRIGADEPTSAHLMKTSLIVYNYSNCADFYRYQRRTLPRGIDQLSMICAGGGKDESKDTCFGDSGGPLQLAGDQYGQYYIVGVTSVGLSCGLPNVPSIYTRVSEYIGWIEWNVWP